MSRTGPLLLLLFFLSGFSALVYQVVWQRQLFAIYGTNIESTTIIVAVFIFGLGCGSLIGGWLSRRYEQHLIALFVFCEAAIGLIGLISLDVIAWFGSFSLGFSLPLVGLLNFMLLVLPTSLMGASLPLLVSFLAREKLTAGEATAQLYYVNTLGSAVASCATVLLLYRVLGLANSVALAAYINLIIVPGALFVSVRARQTVAK